MFSSVLPARPKRLISKLVVSKVQIKSETKIEKVKSKSEIKTKVEPKESKVETKERVEFVQVVGDCDVERLLAFDSLLPLDKKDQYLEFELHLQLLNFALKKIKVYLMTNQGMTGQLIDLMPGGHRPGQVCFRVLDEGVRYGGYLEDAVLIGFDKSGQVDGNVITQKLRREFELGV